MKSVRRITRAAMAVCIGGAALFAAGAPQAATAAGPVGYTVLGGEGACALAQVDLTTGAQTLLGTEDSDKCVFDLAFTPDGSKLYGVRIDSDPKTENDIAILVQFDTATGASTDLGQLGDFNVGGPGNTQGNLTFDNAGAPFTYLVPIGEIAPLTEGKAQGEVGTTATVVPPECDGSAFCLFGVNTADLSTLTYVNHVPQGITVYWGLATSCAGSTVSAYASFEAASTSAGWPDVSTRAPSGQTLASVNLTASGAATTDIGGVTGGSIDSLDYDTPGTLYAVGHDVEGLPSLQTVNPSTGALTKVATLTINGETSGYGTGALAIAHPCTPAPQPAADVIIAPRFTG